MALSNLIPNPLADLGLPALKLGKRKEETYEPGPDEREAMMRRIGRMSLGGLAMAGNFLDLPLSVIRDTLAGENPVDQFLTPFSATNRVQMRELLGPKHLGLLGRNRDGLDAGDVVAFGADILADPLTYLSLGGSALSKAGQVGKKAGLLAHIPTSAGKRVGRLKTTLGELIAAAPAGAREAAEKAAGGAAELANLEGQKLGGLVGLGMPFRAPSKILGTGDSPAAVNIAKWLDEGADKAAHPYLSKLNFLSPGAVRYSAPGRAAARIFSAPIGEAKTKLLQLASGARHAIFEGDRAKAAQWVEFLPKFMQKHGLDDSADDFIRNLGEAREPGEIAAEISNFQVFYRQKYGNDIASDELYDLADKMQSWRESVEQLGGDVGTGVTPFSAASPAGVPPIPGAKNPAYLPRHGAEDVEAIFSARDSRPGSTRTSEMISRRDFLRDLETSTIRRVFKDPSVEAAIKAGKGVDEIAAEIAKIRDVPATYWSAKQLEEIEAAYKRSLSNDPLAAAEGAKVLAAIAKKGGKDRYKALAKLATSEKITEEMRKAGFFAHTLTHDMEVATRHAMQAASQGRWNLGILANKDLLKDAAKIVEDPNNTKLTAGTWVLVDNGPTADKSLGRVVMGKGAKPTVAIKGPGGWHTAQVDKRLLTVGKVVEPALHPELTKLKAVISDLGQKGDAPMVELFRKINGRAPNVHELAELEMKYVPREVADDLVRVVEHFRAPKPLREIKGIDSITNLWKGMATSMLPRFAFHFRNLASGQVKNMLDGMFSPRSFKQTWDLTHGRTATGLLDHPLILAEAKARGITNLTDDIASDLARDLAARHSVVGRFEGEALSRVGASANAPGVSFADYMGKRPGQTPVGFRSALKKFFGRDPNVTWNPAQGEIRGFRGANRTTLAPFVAGEEMGKLVEDLNRLSPWLDLTRKGMDPEQARHLVEWAQVGYSQRFYTPTEQMLTRVFPFYKFAKGSTQHTIKELTERPGGPLGRLVRAEGGANDETRPVPEHISQGLAIPITDQLPLGLGKLLSPPEGVSRYLTGFGLMHENDPFAFLGSPQQAGMELASRLNPLLKAPLEWTTGQSFFQRGPGGARAIEDLDPLLGRTFANVKGMITGENERPPELPGGWRDVQQGVEFGAANAVGSLAAMARTITDPRKSIPVKALNLLTGMRLSDVSEGTREAMQREAATSIMRRMPGSRIYSNVYFSKEEMAAMDPEQRDEAMSWQWYYGALRENAKTRAKAKEGKADKLKKLRKAMSGRFTT